MRVIMLADVKGIGKKGQIVEVKDGYASNFLIPRKLAVKETTKSVEILDKQNAEAEAKRLAQEKLDYLFHSFSTNYMFNFFRFF